MFIHSRLFRVWRCIVLNQFSTDANCWSSSSLRSVVELSSGAETRKMIVSHFVFNSISYLMVKIRSCQFRNCCWHSSNTEFWSTSRHVVFHMVLLFHNLQRFFSHVSTSTCESFSFLRSSVFFERIRTARSSNGDVSQVKVTDIEWKSNHPFFSFDVHTFNGQSIRNRRSYLESETECSIFRIGTQCVLHVQLRSLKTGFLLSENDDISWKFHSYDSRRFFTIRFVPCICYRFSIPMEKSMESLFFFLREYQHQI